MQHPVDPQPDTPFKVAVGAGCMQGGQAGVGGPDTMSPLEFSKDHSVAAGGETASQVLGAGAQLAGVRMYAAGLEPEGPDSKESSLHAFSVLPDAPQHSPLWPHAEVGAAGGPCMEHDSSDTRHADRAAAMQTALHDHATAAPATAPPMAKTFAALDPRTPPGSPPHHHASSPLSPLKAAAVPWGFPVHRQEHTRDACPTPHNPLAPHAPVPVSVAASDPVLAHPAARQLTFDSHLAHDDGRDGGMGAGQERTGAGARTTAEHQLQHGTAAGEDLASHGAAVPVVQGLPLGCDTRKPAAAAAAAGGQQSSVAPGVTSTLPSALLQPVLHSSSQQLLALLQGSRALAQQLGGAHSALAAAAGATVAHTQRAGAGRGSPTIGTTAPGTTAAPAVQAVQSANAAQQAVQAAAGQAVRAPEPAQPSVGVNHWRMVEQALLSAITVAAAHRQAQPDAGEEGDGEEEQDVGGSGSEGKGGATQADKLKHRGVRTELQAAHHTADDSPAGKGRSSGRHRASTAAGGGAAEAGMSGAVGDGNDDGAGGGEGGGLPRKRKRKSALDSATFSYDHGDTGLGWPHSAAAAAGGLAGKSGSGTAGKAGLGRAVAGAAGVTAGRGAARSSARDERGVAMNGVAADREGRPWSAGAGSPRSTAAAAAAAAAGGMQLAPVGAPAGTNLRGQVTFRRHARKRSHLYRLGPVPAAGGSTGLYRTSSATGVCQRMCVIHCTRNMAEKCLPRRGVERAKNRRESLK